MTAGWTRRSLMGLVVVLIGVVGFTACTPPTRYVSLGDSYTSGPLIPVQRDDPFGCLRSTNNYPSLLAPSLDVTQHRDPSCSGAQTKDMNAPQTVRGGSNDPQFNSLDRHTSIVTLGIGGNDIGFTDIATTCGQKGSTNQFGAPCKAFFTLPDGSNEIAHRIADTAPNVRAVLQGIATKAPNAEVFVVGYPAILPEEISLVEFLDCYKDLPVALGDMAWLRDEVEKALNTMLEAEAALAGVTYVDTYTPSEGHDACQAPIIRWVEPLIPVDGAAPVHPNARGMQGVADALEAAMAG